MESAADLFEVMRTMRAMRRLKPDPVSDELVREILELATCAPNGGNRQGWAFLVVRDPEVKAQVQKYYADTYESLMGPYYRNSAPPVGVTAEQYRRQVAATEYLTEHFHEAPVWIVACLRDGATPRRTAGSDIYPAVQNILLACRALGLGATLTNRHTLQHEVEVDAIFGLPEGVHSYAIVPIGHPLGRFGPVRRAPLADVTFADRWGTPWAGATPGE